MRLLADAKNSLEKARMRESSGADMRSVWCEGEVGVSLALRGGKGDAREGG